MMKQQPELTALFDTYCEAHTASDWQLLKSIEAVPIDELISENKQAAYDYLYSDIPLKKKLFWLNKLFFDCGFDDYKQLLGLLKEESKWIRRVIEKIILDKEKKTRKILEKLLPELDEDTQNWARQMFSYWDDTRPSAKRIKIKDKKAALDYSSKHIELYRTQQIAWVPPRPYTMIHWANETNADEYVPRHVIRFILSEYMTAIQPIRLYACDAIAAHLEEKEWQAALETLLQFWLSDGAEANKRAILMPYCMYASEHQIHQLHTTLKSWVNANRKLLAGYTLSVLGIKATPAALQLINYWMVLGTNTMYRREAWKAFKQIATEKGLSTEELADQSIPSFGFNRQSEKVVDYDTRTFHVTLLPDFSLSVVESETKKISKSLPAPSKSKGDNREKAEAAREEMADMKKIVKRQTRVQRKRMELALRNGRTWTKEAWIATFIDNPFMRYLSPGLIWGVYKDGQLQESFRYLEDGSFTTANDEVFTLPEEAVISLVHPMELTDEVLAKWKQQLDDYEIVPFIPQLSTPIRRIDSIQMQEDAITHYSGRNASINNIYDTTNPDINYWTDSQTIYIIDRSMNVLVQLSYTLEESNCFLQELYFSPLEEGEDSSTVQLPKTERLPISSVPERFISYILDLLITAFNLE